MHRAGSGWPATEPSALLVIQLGELHDGARRGPNFDVLLDAVRPIAMLKGRIAVTALLDRLARLRLAQPREHLRWRPGLVLRGLEGLPVERD